LHSQLIFIFLIGLQFWSKADVRSGTGSVGATYNKKANTAGIRISDKRKKRVKKDCNEKDEDVVQQIHEVESHPHAQLYIIDIGSKSNLLLVYDVATARAQLQLITVLNMFDLTLLLSN
jgi:hypothetical protein